MSYRLVIVGPPGAGKGTQANAISENFNVPWVSTGQVFREAIASGSDLGTLLASYIEAGNLVPDELTDRVVANRLDQMGKSSGFLLDGYPRTLSQVDALDVMLADRDQQLDAVIELQIPDEAIIGRLLRRAELENRADDTEEVIRHRIEVYHNSTRPLLEVYRNRGLVVAVDGMGSIADVEQRLIAQLRAALDAR
ncbi:adenylate kinase [Trueperella sp. LYQ143]|uniref:adenylate kinase n=1 Tax=unclassified Trueperella TaxID=2630174 RepID=UPI0039832350